MPAKEKYGSKRPEKTKLVIFLYVYFYTNTENNLLYKEF